MTHSHRAVNPQNVRELVRNVKAQFEEEKFDDVTVRGRYG